MSASAPIDLRGTTREIEESYIGGGSRDSYMGTLVLLFMFLFDSARSAELFTAANLLILTIADEKDKSTSTDLSSSQMDGGNTSLVEDISVALGIERPQLREAVKGLLSKLGEDDYQPIVLDKLTYDDIAGFMNSKKKKLSSQNTSQPIGHGLRA